MTSPQYPSPIHTDSSRVRGGDIHCRVGWTLQQFTSSEYEYWHNLNFTGLRHDLHSHLHAACKAQNFRVNSRPATLTDQMSHHSQSNFTCKKPSLPELTVLLAPTVDPACCMPTYHQVLSPPVSAGSPWLAASLGKPPGSARHLLALEWGQGPGWWECGTPSSHTHDYPHSNTKKTVHLQTDCYLHNTVYVVNIQEGTVGSTK